MNAYRSWSRRGHAENNAWGQRHKQDSGNNDIGSGHIEFKDKLDNQVTKDAE